MTTPILSGLPAEAASEPNPIGETMGRYAGARGITLQRGPEREPGMRRSGYASADHDRRVHYSGDSARAHPRQQPYRTIPGPARRILSAMLFVVILTAPSCSDDDGAGPGGGNDQATVELELVADGFDNPVQVVSPEADPERLFIVEQPGVILILRDGQVLPEPFLDISSLVSYGGEQGLLSMVFPPGSDGTDNFYVDYTRDGDGATVVARYYVSPQNPDSALAGSAETVITVDQPFGNHNGGMTAFGPDGYLYIALGDGGGSGDPEGNGQDTQTLLGSILRIDVESAADPYGIPGDNPYAGVQGYRDEIWAYGLRNPWRFSFDRSTGDMYIADVGQENWEEIDYQPASSPGGENYGWNIMEGSSCYGSGSCDQAGLILPVYEYGHGPECSVTGGYVYRGSAAAGLEGTYIFGDYCSGKIWGLEESGGDWNSRVLIESGLSIVSFGEDAAGEMYVVDRGGGIYLIR